MMDELATQRIEAAAAQRTVHPLVREVEVFHFRRQAVHSYARNETPEGKVAEFDTFTCGHDNIVVYMSKTRPMESRYRCPHCMVLLCDPCARQFKFDKTCRQVTHVMDLVTHLGEQQAHEMGIAPFNIDGWHRWQTAQEIQNRRIY